MNRFGSEAAGATTSKHSFDLRLLTTSDYWNLEELAKHRAYVDCSKEEIFTHTRTNWTLLVASLFFEN
jgi:hypothetical protein